MRTFRSAVNLPETGTASRWQLAASLSFAALLCLIAIGSVIVSGSIHNLQQSDEQFAVSSQTLRKVDELRSLLADAETGERGFLLTGETEFLRPYEESVGQLNAAMNGLRTQVKDSPKSREVFSRLSDRVADELSQLRIAVDLARQSPGSTGVDPTKIRSSQAVMDEVRGLTQELRVEADSNLQTSVRVRDSLIAEARTDLMVSSIGIVLLLFITYLLLMWFLNSHKRQRLERDLHAEELESAVQSRTAQLTEAIKELEGFTYSVSHDMRAPLRWIVASSQILLEDHGEGLDGEAAELLTRQITAGNKLSTLIDDLLTYARLSRQQIERKTVDLAQVADEFLRKEDVTLISPKKLIAQGDPETLSIVMQNLLENALKYRSEKRRLEITLGEVYTDNGRAFFVRDNGIGFDPKYVHKIFLPFERLHRDTVYPGTGIGLANVQRIIEKHGGRVWAGASPDAGATFFFTLP